MNIAIIGLGEVGRCLASHLIAQGGTPQLCEARPSPAALHLAEAAGIGIEAMPGPWLAGADWVFSCVTGAVSLAVAESALPFLAHGQRYADLTTASPDSKRRAARRAAAAGIDYVDVAIMGSIAMLGPRTPLLAAGAEAAAFCSLINSTGGRASCVADGQPGDAIALKFMRSMFTKGLEALAVELLVYAERAGARAQLFAQLQDIDDMPLKTLLEGLVRTHVIHARRRAHEVEEAAREMASHGLSSLVLPGVAQRFQATVAQVGDRPLAAADVSLEQALEWLGV